MRNKMLLVFCLLGAAWAGAGPVHAEEIRGRILWQGPVPAPDRVEVKAKPGQGSDFIKGCGHEKESPALRIDPSGGVENVVIWVEGARQVPPAQGTVLLDQQACEFLPHVVAVRAGDRIAIRNSDQVIHSVRIFQEGKPSYLMNRWQKVKAPDLIWTPETPGRYLARCGVHLWMYAWIIVLPTPFATISDASGDFHLVNLLPPGKYRLHFWHEKTGEWEQTIEVAKDVTDLGTVRFPRRVLQSQSSAVQADQRR